MHSLVRDLIIFYTSLSSVLVSHLPIYCTGRNSGIRLSEFSAGDDTSSEQGMCKFNALHVYKLRLINVWQLLHLGPVWGCYRLPPLLVYKEGRGQLSECTSAFCV